MGIPSPFWLRPLFSDKFLLGYSGQIQEKADLLRFILNERIKYTKSSEAVCDVQHCLKLATLDIIGSIGFGFQFQCFDDIPTGGSPSGIEQSRGCKTS